MKSFLFSALLLLCSAAAVAADTITPKIMVFPSDDWCVAKGFVLDDGKTPDYENALRDTDMDGAIGIMGDIMAEMGYEMYSLKQSLKDIHTEDAYSMVVTSKNDGIVRESPRDLITRNVGCDFIVELLITPKPFGARRVIEFKAQTIDAASRKILHGDIGTSSASSAPTPILVKEAVGVFIDNFCHKIDMAFSKMEQNGREGSVVFKIADDCHLTFEDTVSVGGESGSLAEYIEYWISERTVDSNCNITQKSKETLRCDQIHFPLFAKVAAGSFGSRSGKVKAQTMTSFIGSIEKDLILMNISVTVVPIGQGSAYVVLGGN